MIKEINGRNYKIVKCKNCGKRTKNKFFCSRECMNRYKFLRGKSKTSKLERYIFIRLQQEYPHFIINTCERQILQENLELDIYMPQLRIAFEINGPMHYKFIPRFHGTRKRFKQQLERDERKRIICDRLNILLINIPNLKNFSAKFAEEVYQTQVKQFIRLNLNI